MDYKEKYENLINTLKSAINNEEKSGYTFKSVIDSIMPELKESEDERIRKEIISHLKSDGLTTNHKWISWLEKQKEPKSVEIKDISIQKMVEEYRYTDEYDEAGNFKGKPVNCMVRAYEKGIRDVLTVIKTEQVEWSEEDEKKWSQVINEIEAIKSNSSTIFEKNVAQDKIDWLKSVKDRVK